MGGVGCRAGVRLISEGRTVVEEILTFVRESPIILLGAAFLLALLGYALVKRLLKMALFVGVFIAIYLGLLWFLGHPLPFGLG